MRFSAGGRHVRVYGGHQAPKGVTPAWVKGLIAGLMVATLVVATVMIVISLAQAVT